MSGCESCSGYPTDHLPDAGKMVAPDPARLAAEEIQDDYYDGISLSDVRNCADIIRKHYAETQAEIERMRKVVAAADRMADRVRKMPHTFGGPSDTRYLCDSLAIYDAARKELM